jgi:hypothetical protein
MPQSVIMIQRHTQRSLKLIRRVASHVFSTIPWKPPPAPSFDAPNPGHRS